MASNKQSLDTEFSEQTILNRSYDRGTSALGTESLGYDGTQNLQREVSKMVATKIQTAGNITYVAKAPVGTPQSSASWQAKAIDTTSGVVITWADSNSNFDNVATDLSTLTYG